MAMQEHVYGADLTSDFDKDINLKFLVGQDQGCKILQTIIDEHHWEQNLIKPILLYGRSGSSAIARAFSNSLCNTAFFEVESGQIGCGVSLHELIERIDEFTTYHIKGVDMIAYMYNHQLFRLVKDRLIYIPAIRGLSQEYKRYFWGQLVLSVEKPTKFTKTLEKYCEAVIHLNDCLEGKDIIRILRQRIDYFGIELQDKPQIIEAIVQVVSGDVKLGIELLKWSLKSCYAQGESKVTIQHLNQALMMLG